VYSVGSEPDVRFTFANERTFLAWVRTSLALLASGVALEVLGVVFQAQLRLTASLLLVMAGIGVAASSWFEWKHAERALRRGEALPRSLLGLGLVIVVIIVGVLVVLSAVLS